jgi:hypothetical protein
MSTSPFSRHSIKTRANVLSLSTAMVLISGSAFAEDTGKAAFDAYMEGLKKFGVSIENGSVDYDQGSDTLTIKDSTLSFSGTIKDVPSEEIDVSKNDGATDIDEKKLTDLNYSVSFAAGTVIINGLTHEDDQFSVKSWVYSDDAKLVATGSTDGEGRLKLEGRLAGTSATNYSFTLPDLPAEDPEHQVSRWLPFVKTVALASYDEVKVDSTGITYEVFETEDDIDKLVISGTVQMGGFRMLDVVEGRVGEYSIDRLTQSMQARDSSNGHMITQTASQGKTIYKDVNYGAMIALFDPTVPESGDEVTILGSASAVDYETNQEIAPGLTLKMSVEKATMDNMTLVKRENDLLSLLDQALNKKAPSPEELLTSVFQVYRSFGVADARVSGISVTVPTPETDQDVTVDIKEMAMTDMSSDGIGEMMIVGLNAPSLPEGASLKLDWAAIGDIEFAEYTPMKAMISNLMADPDFGENNPLEVARAFMPRSFAYEVEGLDVNVPEVGRTEIGKAEMSISTTVPPIPTSFYVKNDGIKFPVSAIEDREAQELLQTLGLDTVVWSDETRLFWDEATLELRLERLMMNIEGVGMAEASARFANVPKALFEDPEGQGQMAAIVAQFVDASFVFNDSGVTAKGLAHIAKEEGIPENVFREALVAQAAQATAPIQNEAFTKMVSEAASKFLKDPKQLKITLTPASPVPLAQILGSLAAPQTLPDLLNVKIVAN